MAYKSERVGNEQLSYEYVSEMVKVEAIFQVYFFCCVLFIKINKMFNYEMFL